MKNMKNESGRTMLEMLGVLAIMGIIMYGAVSGINYGMSTYKVNQVYNDVQDQMQGITDLYSWSRSYPKNNIFTQKLCENDIFSQSCSGIDDSHPYGTTGNHAFGGAIYATGTADGNNFILQYEGIPNSACERLMEMEWGNIKRYKVNGTVCAEKNDPCTCNGASGDTIEWTWK